MTRTTHRESRKAASAQDVETHRRARAVARRLRALGVRAAAEVGQVTLEVHVAEELVSRLEDQRKIEERGYV